MESILQYCFEEAEAIFFTLGNVPPFILYTHLTAGVLSFLIGLFVLRKGDKGQNLPNKIMAWSLGFFAYWVFANIIIWGTNRGDVVMFLWSLQIMFEPLVYIGLLYMVYVMLYGKDTSLKSKIIVGLLYLPLVLIIPTEYNLYGIDLIECIPLETYPAFYTYVLELCAALSILAITIYRYRQLKDREQKRKTVYLGVGSMLFLMAFASGNIFGSITGEWVNTQFGLLGMPIFATVLAYLVVRYQIFQAKLLGAQVLVVGLWILVFSLIFIRNIEVILWILIPTLILLVILGLLLIKSVKREVEQREELERLAKKLSDFISFATHELRGPITAFKGAISMIMEGNFGKVPAETNKMLNKVYLEADEMGQTVETFLNMNKIEIGKFDLMSEEQDFVEVVESAVEQAKYRAGDKKIDIKFVKPKGSFPAVNYDRFKIKHAVGNLLSNAIKYTDEGGKVRLTLEHDNAFVILHVADTGIGIPAEVLPNLFNQYNRGAAEAKRFAEGSGIGLWLTKQIVDLHGGKLSAESKGQGMGSTFTIKLPVNGRKGGKSKKKE